MPERMCIVTREVMDEAALLRFVAAPDGTVVPDLKRNLPGRGVWVSLDRAKLAEATSKNLFSRGFACKIQADPELPDRLARLLRADIVSCLSLARKAGEAVSGFMKVEEALKRGPVRVLLHVADAGDDGVRKLNRLAGENARICSFMTMAELDLAFARANVVHAAVAAGGLAEKLVFHLGRLAAYEGLPFTSKTN